MSEIHDAAFRGKKDKVLKAIEQGEDVNKTIIVFNNTESPLSLSIQFSSAEMVQLLLKKGADPNLLVIKKGRMITPLELVLHWCEIAKAEKARLLLQHGADPNATNNPMSFNPLATAVQGTTHYDKAAKKSYFEITKLLLEYGADVGSIDDYIKEEEIDAEVKNLLKEFRWKASKDEVKPTQLEQELVSLLSQANKLHMSLPISGENEMRVSVRMVPIPDSFSSVKPTETGEKPSHNLVRKIARIRRAEKSASGNGSIDFEEIRRNGTLIVKNIYRSFHKEETKIMELVASSDDHIFLISLEGSKKSHIDYSTVFEKVLNSLSLL